MNEQLLTEVEEYRVAARPFIGGGWIAMPYIHAEIEPDDEEWWSCQNAIFDIIYPTFLEALQAAVDWEKESRGI